MGEEGLQGLDVAVLITRVPVVIDADDVEEAPVDRLEGQRRVGEPSVEVVPLRPLLRLALRQLAMACSGPPEG
jgi:hypothetical protein